MQNLKDAMQLLNDRCYEELAFYRKATKPKNQDCSGRQELIDRVAALWVKNGMTLQDLWKYSFQIESAISREQTQLGLEAIIKEEKALEEKSV